MIDKDFSSWRLRLRLPGYGEACAHTDQQDAAKATKRPLKRHGSLPCSDRHARRLIRGVGLAVTSFSHRLAPTSSELREAQDADGPIVLKGL
jgi:hypothetical protein